MRLDNLAGTGITEGREEKIGRDRKPTDLAVSISINMFTFAFVPMANESTAFYDH